VSEIAKTNPLERTYGQPPISIQWISVPLFCAWHPGTPHGH